MRIYGLVERMIPDPLPGFEACRTARGEPKLLSLTFPAQKSLHYPPVTIIISTLNRSAYLGRTLQALFQLRYAKFEVVVVEGPSSDDTSSVLDQWATRLKRVSCNQQNLSTSRNIGIEAAAGDLIAFIDDDAVPEPDWLDRLVEPFRDPTVGATGGAIRNWTGWRYQCRALTVDIGANVRRCTADELALGDLCPAFTGTNFCVRRNAVLAAGKFDEAYAYFLEESDLQMILFRAGMRLVYVARAEVHHLRAPNAHRDSDRLPADYAAKLRSVAYFCLKQRHDGDDRIDVLIRIARQIELTAMELQRFLRKGRINEAAAAQRLRSAFRGLRDGIKLYGDRAPISRLPESPPRLPPFQLFNSGSTDALHVAVICRGANQKVCQTSAEDLAKALAQQSCHVTLVKAGSENAVAYLGNYWQHSRKRNAVVSRTGRGLNLNLAIAELVRVDSKRSFQVVVDLNYARSHLTMGVYLWTLYRERSTRLSLLRPKGSMVAFQRVKPDQLSERVDDIKAACLRLNAQMNSANVQHPAKPTNSVSIF